LENPSKSAVSEILRPACLALKTEATIYTGSPKLDNRGKKLKKKIYSLPVKSFRSVRFFMFLKEVTSAHQGCNYLIKNTKKNSNIVKYYYNLKQ